MSTSMIETIREETAHNEVARRAYELWEQEGRNHGNHEQHWLNAEQQLRRSPQPAPKTSANKKLK